MGFFGREKELLPKDVLVDLEFNPKRGDEMIDKFLKGEEAFDQNFVAAQLNADFDRFGITTASAARAFGVSELERALRQMEMQQQDLIRRAEFERAAQMQNQIGGLRNGLANQGIGNALGGLGGIFGPPR